MSAAIAALDRTCKALGITTVWLAPNGRVASGSIQSHVKPQTRLRSSTGWQGILYGAVSQEHASLLGDLLEQLTAPNVQVDDGLTLARLRFAEAAATGSVLDHTAPFSQSLVGAVTSLPLARGAAVLSLSIQPEVEATAPVGWYLGKESVAACYQALVMDSGRSEIVYVPLEKPARTMAVIPYGTAARHALVVDLASPQPLPAEGEQLLLTWVRTAGTWMRHRSLVEEHRQTESILEAVSGIGELFAAPAAGADYDALCRQILRIANARGVALYLKEPNGLLKLISMQGDVLTGPLDPRIVSYDIPFYSGEAAQGNLTIWAERGLGSTTRHVLTGVVHAIGLALGFHTAIHGYRETWEQSIFALAAAIEARDPYTRGHSDRVGKWSAEIADKLGLTAYDANLLRFSGYLHDAGKIGIPEHVLNKPGRYDESDWAFMKAHPIVGEQIVSGIRALSGLAPGIRSHHENFNGTGYPDGLSGDEIPLYGRILRVADTFDAITSDRPYKRGKPAAVALEIIREGAGTDYDPEIVLAFADVLATNLVCEREAAYGKTADC